MKVAGRWRYVYRAVDQFDQVINATRVTPVEVTADQAPVYTTILEDLLRHCCIWPEGAVAGNKVEPLPVQTAARSAQSSQPFGIADGVQGLWWRTSV